MIQVKIENQFGNDILQMLKGGERCKPGQTAHEQMSDMTTLFEITKSCEM